MKSRSSGSRIASTIQPSASRAMVPRDRGPRKTSKAMRGDNRYSNPLSPGPLERAARTMSEGARRGPAAQTGEELEPRPVRLGRCRSERGVRLGGGARSEAGGDRPDAAHQECDHERGQEGGRHLRERADPHVRGRQRLVQGASLRRLQQEEGADLESRQAEPRPNRGDAAADAQRPDDRLPQEQGHDQGCGRRQRAELRRVVPLLGGELVGELVTEDGPHPCRNARSGDAEAAHAARARRVPARGSVQTEAHARIIRSCRWTRQVPLGELASIRDSCCRFVQLHK